MDITEVVCLQDQITLNASLVCCASLKMTRPYIIKVQAPLMLKMVLQYEFGQFVFKWFTFSSKPYSLEGS